MGSYGIQHNTSNNSLFMVSSFFEEDCYSRANPRRNVRETPLICRKQFKFKYSIGTVNGQRRCKRIVREAILFPVDPWAAAIDSPAIATQLSAFSLLPYLGFLYFITKSNSVPRLTLFGFYFLLAFVAAAIPAGIYAKVHYATSLSNVDWLHGGAESLLMFTNLFIVLGLREALREAEEVNGNTSDVTSRDEEKEKR